MLSITERAATFAEPGATLTLPFDRRQKSRLRAHLDPVPGEAPVEVAIELRRGTSLRDGDRLLASNGLVVLVRAAAEPVSVVRAVEPLQLTRVAYHLGNRHMPLQIGKGELLYLHDHVLDDMVRNLGAQVAYEERPFEPEPGAYGEGHSHLHHGRSHGTSAHGHSHDTSAHSHSHDAHAPVHPYRAGASEPSAAHSPETLPTDE